MPAQSAEKIALGATFLGRYEVVEKVGEGGFGIVYKARQLTTGQPVAIKVLRIPVTVEAGTQRETLQVVLAALGVGGAR